MKYLMQSGSCVCNTPSTRWILSFQYYEIRSSVKVKW